MKKKLIALVLAGAMTFGASMTAFAAEGDTTVVDNDTTAEAEVTGEATVKTPVIKVSVPTEMTIVLNPYQLAYEVKEGEGDDAKVVATYKTQIVSIPQEIKSESDVALAVNVSQLKATPESGVEVLPKAVGKATNKAVYLYLEVVKGAADKAKFTGSGLVPTTDGASKNAVITLDAATKGTDGAAVPSVASFKVGGDMVVNPVKANTDTTKEPVSDPWTDSDTVTVSFKFTFTPQMASGK